jgi:hypothetical protein
METPSQRYNRLHHDRRSITKWKSRGLILKEGETYEDIYKKVYSTRNCELCNLVFDNINRPEMDHDHSTGYFRKVLCRCCNASYLQRSKKSYKNNKTGHKHIGYREKRGYYTVSKSINGKRRFNREFKNKIDAICYKYIMLLKIKSNLFNNG